jgi:Zn-dependent protease
MGRRDPRADIIDDDPFKQKPRIARVHSRRGDDGTIHFEMNGSSTGSINPLLAQFMGLQPNKPANLHTGGIWHFSDEEKKHLRLAVFAFTLAASVFFNGGIWSLFASGFTHWIVEVLSKIPVVFFALAPAFLLHEIGHKVVARKYGCWSEFRADPNGLRLGVIMAFFLPVLFMAPGAVLVAGIVPRRENGHIAIAGPLTNFGLFLIGIPLWGIILGLTGSFDAELTTSMGEYFVDGSLIWQQMLIDTGWFWLFGNLGLAVFNMIPYGPLDGVKIKDWNQKVFYIVMGIFLIVSITGISGFWSPTIILEMVAGLF